MSRYLGIIPARGGSKGIPGKNLAQLGDRPLLQYTLEAALASRRLDRTVFTSDDPEMIELARGLGADVPFQRPANLATDSASSVDVVLHALDWLDREEGYRPDIVVLLQPTCPFRDAVDIDAAVHAYEESGRETLLTVSPVLQHPCDMVRIVDGRLVRAVERSMQEGSGRQGLPEYYFVDGAIYTVKPSFLREHRVFCDESSAAHVIERSHGVDIDDLYQLRLARGLLATEAGCGHSPERKTL